MEVRPVGPSAIAMAVAGPHLPYYWNPFSRQMRPSLWASLHRVVLSIWGIPRFWSLVLSRPQAPHQPSEIQASISGSNWAPVLQDHQVMIATVSTMVHVVSEALYQQAGGDTVLVPTLSSSRPISVVTLPGHTHCSSSGQTRTRLPQCDCKLPVLALPPVSMAWMMESPSRDNWCPHNK